jgi:hypothetical protein
VTDDEEGLELSERQLEAAAFLLLAVSTSVDKVPPPFTITLMLVLQRIPNGALRAG